MTTTTTTLSAVVDAIRWAHHHTGRRIDMTTVYHTTTWAAWQTIDTATTTIERLTRSALSGEARDQLHTVLYT